MNLTLTVAEREELLRLARTGNLGRRPAKAPIERVDRGGRLPLSFAQQRLWFLDRLGSAGAAYHMSTRVRLTGALDREALGRALDRIVARHEALRTTFPDVDGGPVQRIAPAAESAFRLVDHDLRDDPAAEASLDGLIAEEAKAPFDLACGPLVRGRLVRLAGDEHVLLITMHHIVSDGWSLAVFTRELNALYAAFRRGEDDPLPPLPVQYADYAAWQRRSVEGEVLERQAEYWKATLSGVPELLELPADRLRPSRQDYAGASARVVLDADLTARVKALGQRHGTTLFMTLLAGWAVVLSRLSGGTDIVIGAPTANRGRREIEGLIGVFVNTLPLRVDVSGWPTVTQLLQRVKERVLGAQLHQDIPFEQVVELVQPVRSLAYSPLFQVMFAWQNTPHGSFELPELIQRPAGSAPRGTAKFDLVLSLADAGGRIAGGIEYATALFDPETVTRWLGYLRSALQGMADDDRRTVDRLPLLPDAERLLVVREWNATASAYPEETCLHELVEAQAGRTPDAIAVAFDDRQLTYAALNARANGLAHHLRALGVGPDARVGICAERSPEMVVGLLAILKAGGAYVPLDASYPVERLRYMLEDSAPVVLLTHPPLIDIVNTLNADARLPAIDLADNGILAARTPMNPRREDVGLEPHHLAYVIYTSGSTGRPKGVMLEHQGLVNRLVWMQAAHRMEPHEALLHKTPFGFDVSFWEFFWPLTAGGRLVIARPGGHRDPEYLIETIRREGITTVHFVASLLQLFLEHPQAGSCSGLTRVVSSGEAVPAALVRQFGERLPGVRLFDQYGPTESGEATEWRCVLERVQSTVPIGRPIANTRIYILDTAGEPVPVGVPGDLYIGGVAVARGYFNRPRLTAERFVADPFSPDPGARMYRTGDLSRWLPDGTIDFLGRIDSQVKVRGFRVEPGEIETRLTEHPGVREAVVVAREDPPGGARLVAYYVGEELEAETLRAHVSETLPEYMVPVAFVRLEAFPLTPNGKLDRTALPNPDVAAYATRAYEAPVGEVEEALAQIWSELLGVTQVGRRDHFFQLGGNSLRAVQVVSRVRELLGIGAALGDVFVRPVLADFARGLEQASRAGLPAIERADRGERMALSFAQQRLWFLEQMGGAGAAYHIPVRLRLKGQLDAVALRAALDRIVARHEVLRTTFPEADGAPVQRIAAAEESPFTLLEHDLSVTADSVAHGFGVAQGFSPANTWTLDRIVAEEASAPFDLALGPLIRGRLLRLGADDHLLLITMHHIVSDGWSLGVFSRELSALYGAFRRGEADPLPPLPVQYADYALWQRRSVDGDVLAQQAEYWTTTLAGAPALLELPADHARPARQDFAGASVAVELDERLTAGLQALSARSGTTLFMTLLAGWAIVLSRLSGQTDVVVGTPSANRGRREVEGLIGFFVNTLAVRLDLSGSPSVAALLRRVKQRVLGAQQHQDIPFEQVVERVQPARSLAHGPLFQVMFAWQDTPRGRLELPGLDLAPAGRLAETTAKFDLTLSLSTRGRRIAGSVQFATALFDQPSIERWIGCLRRVLEGMAADERQQADRLRLMSEAERRQVVEAWNATAVQPAGRCLPELFEAQVARRPDVVAVVFDGAQLTYAALNARANRLAHDLRERGVEPDARVAICVERGLGMIVGTLAVLKAGGAYVPLDPAYPRERLRQTLEDSDPVVLLAERSSRELFAGLAVPLLELDADVPAWAGQPAANPAAAGLRPDHLAYVIYTSGSTGVPKGVMVEHRQVARLFSATAAWFGFGAHDVWTLFHSFAFDFSVWESWGALVHGGRLVVVARDTARVPEAFARLVCSEQVTVLNQTPSAFRQFMAAQAASGMAHGLRTVVFGGEALEVAALAPWFARPEHRQTRLINMYGITETTVHVTYRPLAKADTAWRGGSPVGVRIPDLRIYILDGQGEPVPVGAAGELYVGGAGVARGYLRRPAWTAGRFVADPFSAAPGARLYRTGDLARWRADGTIEFLGRHDFQVKIRGFRIELGEIEATLLEHPAVRDAVVVTREDAPGDRRLVAYYVGAQSIAAGALRAHLAERLPEHMVPAAYERLAALPLTANGKLDRKALPSLNAEAYATRAFEVPSGDVEEALARTWSALLGVERVGRYDNFFELGGHSLLAAQAAARARQLGIDVNVASLFSHPTVESLAGTLRGTDRHARTDRAIPVRPTGSERPLFLIHEGTGSSAYAQVLHPHIHRGIPVYALPAPSPPAPSLRTVEGMAMRLVRMIRDVQPAGPYRLAGWSFGGLLAYEAAIQLIGDDEAVEFLGLIDTYYTAGGRSVAEDARSDDALLARMLRMEAAADAGGTEEPVQPAAAATARAHAMQTRLRVHRRALGEYFPQPMPIPVHLFPAQERPGLDPRRGWQALLSDASLRVAPVPGTHLSMMEPDHVGSLGEALARAIRRASGHRTAPPEDGYAPLVTLRFGSATKAPLFCVPGAGANGASFADLGTYLDPDRSMYVFQPRGVDGEMVPHSTVQAAAACYLRPLQEIQPAGPVHLLGHSFGGWVVFEMARRLRSAGRLVGSLTLVDSRVPDEDGSAIREYDNREAFLKLVQVTEQAVGRPLAVSGSDIDSLDETERLRLLHEDLVRLGLMPRRSDHEVLRGPFRTFATCVRTTYRPADIYPDPLRLVLVCDPAYDEDANQRQFARIIRGWRRWAPALVCSTGDGNHMTVLQSPHVRRLAVCLAVAESACL